MVRERLYGVAMMISLSPEEALEEELEVHVGVRSGRTDEDIDTLFMLSPRANDPKDLIRLTPRLLIRSRC